MSFEVFFNYVVSNSVMISQWLVVCVIGTSLLYLSLRLFFRDKLEGDTETVVYKSGAPPSQDILQNSVVSPVAPSVDEIMAQPGMESEAGNGEVATAPGDTPDTTAPAVDVEAPSGGDLKVKEDEIAQLKSEIDELKKADGGGDSGASADLQAKIDELEGKLAEYEILEDDIADLSKFKEENAKLKEELESLKAGGAAAPATEPAASEEPAAEEAALSEEPAPEPEGEAVEPVAEVEAQPPEPTEVQEEETVAEEAAAKEIPDDGLSKDDLMAEFEAAMDDGEQSANGESTPTESPAEEPPVSEPAAEETPTDEGADFVAEFEAAVQQQKGDEDKETEKPVEGVAGSEPPKPDAVTAAGEDSSGESNEETEAPEAQAGDDILAEFTQSVMGDAPEDEPESKEESGSGLGDLDTDKMLAEMADLATTEADSDGGSALDDEMDTEKMAQEASKLSGSD